MAYEGLRRDRPHVPTGNLAIDKIKNVDPQMELIISSFSESHIDEADTQ